MIVLHHRHIGFIIFYAGILGSNPSNFYNTLYCVKERKNETRELVQIRFLREKKKERKKKIPSRASLCVPMFYIISRPGEQSLGSSFSHLIE